MSTPEIKIGDFQIFVNPNAPEDERKQFEQAMRAILSDTPSDTDDKEASD